MYRIGIRVSDNYNDYFSVIDEIESIMISENLIHSEVEIIFIYFNDINLNIMNKIREYSNSQTTSKWSVTYEDLIDLNKVANFPMRMSRSNKIRREFPVMYALKSGVKLNKLIIYAKATKDGISCRSRTCINRMKRSKDIVEEKDIVVIKYHEV